MYDGDRVMQRLFPELKVEAKPRVPDAALPLLAAASRYLPFGERFILSEVGGPPHLLTLPPRHASTPTHACGNDRPRGASISRARAPLALSRARIR